MVRSPPSPLSAAWNCQLHPALLPCHATPLEPFSCPATVSVRLLLLLPSFCARLPLAHPALRPHAHHHKEQTVLQYSQLVVADGHLPHR